MGYQERKVIYFICLTFFVSCVHSIMPQAFMIELPWFDHGVNLPTKYPLVIAHKGSSGRFPEHTIEGYTAAVQARADVIECDVTVTRDLKLICMHEPWLSVTTDVELRYPGRNNTYDVQGFGKVNDYFTVDFTLSELRILRRKQRYDFRDPNYDGKFGIPTLADYVKVAQTAKRPVGIYPETKLPEFINSLKIMTEANVTFEELLVAELEKFGYRNKKDPCFLQSFDEMSLRRMSEISDLPIVMLFRDSGPDDDRLNDLAKFCYGIGVSKSLIIRTENNAITEVTDLIVRAHRVGLRVHAFSFKNENAFLAWDYGQDALQEYDRFMGLLLDGYFTDFPSTLKHHINTTYQLEEGCYANNSGSHIAYTVTNPFIMYLLVVFVRQFNLLFY